MDNEMLMHMPSDQEIRTAINSQRGIYGLSDLPRRVVHGRDMKSKRYSTYETVWTLPKEVEGKIEDDKKYRIWYYYHDSADSSDMSTYYDVYYIEEA